jgi:hypothetical protein
MMSLGIRLMYFANAVSLFYHNDTFYTLEL